MNDIQNPYEEHPLESYVIRILIYHHKIEYTIYLNAMKMLVDLSLRNHRSVLPVRMIRHSMSSMKFDRETVKYLLRDMQACGFLTHIPKQGYCVNELIDVFNKFLYTPSRTK